MKSVFSINAKTIAAADGIAETSELEILVYGDVGWGVNAGELCSRISSAIKEHGASALTVRVNSFGGDAAMGMAINNYLKSQAIPVTAIVDGVAASAASAIVCGASKVVMPTGSLLMVHNPWGVAVGDGDEMRKAADVSDKYADAYAAIYAAKTKKTVEEMKELMKAESWLDPSEAVAAGFADVAEPSMDVAASIDAEGMEAKLAAKLAEKLAALKAKADAKNQSGDPLKVEYERGLSAGKAEGMLAAKADMAALKAKLSDAENKISRQDKALNEKQSKLDRAEASNVELQGKLEQLLKGGFGYESELESWGQALAKCGGDYAKARRDYPALFSAYMASHPSRKN